MLSVVMLSVIILSVIMLSVIMLSVIMPNVFMLNVVAPLEVTWFLKGINLNNPEKNSKWLTNSCPKQHQF